MTLRTSHLALVGVLLTASGAIHGWWTNRWVAAAPADAGRNLLEMDDGVGDWLPGSFFDLNPADMPPGCRMVSRRFETNRAERSAVVSVTCGHPGIVAVHTPDVCYLGSGYKLKSDVRQEKIPLGPDGASATFYVADFQKDSVSGTDRVRVRWAWTVDGHWKAPDYPRWHFAREPLLYKLYVVHSVSEEDLTADDAYRRFVAALLPALGRHLAH